MTPKTVMAAAAHAGLRTVGHAAATRACAHGAAQVEAALQHPLPLHLRQGRSPLLAMLGLVVVGAAAAEVAVLLLLC